MAKKGKKGNGMDISVSNTLYANYIKRMLDLILSVAAIIVLSPLFLVIMFLELLFHGSPVLYSQKRMGKDKKTFTLYKFRSMTNEVDENGCLLPNEKRLTKFGRVLRRTSLDELPQLFSIIKGDMGIVGPRPLPLKYKNLFTAKQDMRHTVRPGLACMRITRYREETFSTQYTWDEQFENDLWYIQNISLKTDIREILAIAKMAFRGSEARTNATRGAFVGDSTDK